MLVYYYIFTLMYYRTKEFGVREGGLSMNNTIISMKEKELRFKVFHQQKYNVVDFNLIEELDWQND